MRITDTMLLRVHLHGDLDCLIAQGIEDIEVPAPSKGQPGYVDVGYNRIQVWFFVDLHGGVDWHDVYTGYANPMGPDIRADRIRHFEPEDYEIAVYRALGARGAGIQCDYEAVAGEWESQL